MAARGEMQAGLFSHTVDARLQGQGPGLQPRQGMGRRGTQGMRGSHLVSPGRNSGILGGSGSFWESRQTLPLPLICLWPQHHLRQLLAGSPSWHMHPLPPTGSSSCLLPWDLALFPSFPRHPQHMHPAGSTSWGAPQVWGVGMLSASLCQAWARCQGSGVWQLPQAARIDTTDQAAYTTQVCYLTAHRLGVQDQGAGPPQLPEAAVVLAFLPWLHLHMVFTLCLPPDLSL